MNPIDKSDLRLLAAASAAAALLVGVYVFAGGGFALILVVIFALVGRFRSPSTAPPTTHRPSLDTGGGEGLVSVAVREASSVLLGLVAMMMAGFAALILGITIGAIPFLYATGDEVYPFATVYGIASLLFAGWVGVQTWGRLSLPDHQARVARTGPSARDAGSSR